MSATIIRVPPRDVPRPATAEVRALPAPIAAATDAPPHRRRGGAVLRRRVLAGTVVAILLVAAAIAGWFYWNVWRFEISTDDAYVQADSVAIAPQVGGYLTELAVGDNQTVRAGDVLAQIDVRPYAAALAQAKSDVGAAAANVSDLEAQLAEQQSLIAEADATIDVDQAARTFAQQDDVRSGTLAREGYGTQQSAQSASASVLGLTASVTKDKAAADAARKQVAILQAKLDEAKALLGHTQAAARTAELNLGYTTIRAPTDGVVGARTARVGQFLTPGTQLMAIVPLSRIYIVGNFKETQLTDVRPGQSVKVSIDAFPEMTIAGIVDSIAPASGEEFALLPPDNATGNFTKVVQRVPVKIRLDPANPLAGLLRPGMSVTPTIDVSGTATPPAIPPADTSFHKADRRPIGTASTVLAQAQPS